MEKTIVFKRKFDENNPNYIPKDRLYNELYLESISHYFHDILYAQGYLTVLEVFKTIGLTPITRESLSYGWIANGDDWPGLSFISLDDGSMEIVLPEAMNISNAFPEEGL